MGALGFDVPELSPLVFDGDAPCPPALSLDAPLERALGRRWGHFGLHQHDGARHRLARDPLGVHKLFFAVTDDDVVSSPFLFALLQGGFPLDAVSSVPSGNVVEIDLEARTAAMKPFVTLPFGEPDDDLDTEQLVATGAAIRGRLEQVFASLGRALDGRTVYVTLSGGLDSSGVAALARASIPGLRAITFSVDTGDGRLSEDAASAQRVAEALGLPLLVARATPTEVRSHLDDALVFGQDFRDFNVHCALVNAALAAAIAAEHGDAKRPVVLTGDTMNELLADYTPVEYAGRAHYALPRLPPGRVRKFLVQGLDSGDREVGVFARHGVDCVQPYALCAEVYTALPGRVAEHDQAKQRLARAVLGDAVPAFVYERPKVRAQAGGSEPGGTMAALIDEGLDQPALTGRFAELLGLEVPDVEKLIFSGRYRYRRPF